MARHQHPTCTQPRTNKCINLLTTPILNANLQSRTLHISPGIVQLVGNTLIHVTYQHEFQQSQSRFIMLTTLKISI